MPRPQPPTRCFATWFAAYVALLVVLTLADHADAQAHIAVVNVPDAAPRPGFAQALRIQLAGFADIVDAGPNHGLTHSERIEGAIAAGVRTHADAVVWIEGPFARSDGAGELALYIVGRRHDRAVVETLRVATGTDAPSEAVVDRSLAIKVRQVVWELTQGDEVLDIARLDGASRGPIVRFRLLAGLVLKTSTGSLDATGGLRVAAGLQVRAAHHYVDVGARVHVLVPTRNHDKQGDLSIVELAPGLEAGIGVVDRKLRFGGRVTLQARTLRVHGETSKGASDSHWLVLPVIGIGPVMATRLSDTLDLELSLEVELTPQRQRFALNDRVVADAGRVRGALIVGLAWTP